LAVAKLRFYLDENMHVEIARQLQSRGIDFVQLASDGFQHAGIVLGQQEAHGIGTWVKFLELMHSVYTPDDMVNIVEYL